MTSGEATNLWRQIELVLDCSLSMRPIMRQIEQGVQALLAEQRDLPGTSTVSLYQFADDGELVFTNLDLAAVPVITLHPQGNTALLDAIGDTIERASAFVRSLPRVCRPDEILTVILTDGEENRSRRYDVAAVRERIAAQRAKRRTWEFMLLGAGASIFTVAQQLGIERANTLQYDHDLGGTALHTAGRMLRRRSETGHIGFTDEDRTTTRH